jgi:hypothetical protein
MASTRTTKPLPPDEPSEIVSALDMIDDGGADHMHNLVVPRDVWMPSTLPWLPGGQDSAVDLSKLPGRVQHVLVVVLPGIVPSVAVSATVQFAAAFDGTSDLIALAAQLRALPPVSAKAFKLAVVLPCSLLTASQVARTLDLPFPILCDEAQDFTRALQLPCVHIPAASVPPGFGLAIRSSDVSRAVGPESASAPPSVEPNLDDFGYTTALNKRVAFLVRAGRVVRVWYPLAPEMNLQSCLDFMAAID